MLDPADRRVIEAWTGAYDATEHDSLYTDLGDAHLVARHVLRARLAELTCLPAQAGVDGGYSENYQHTISLLQDRLGRLEDLIVSLGVDVPSGGLLVAPIVRAGPRVR